MNQNISEKTIIDNVTKKFKSPVDAYGIGDDCAVIKKNKTSSWLISTDALAEGIHFLRNKISPTDLGYKSVVANASDIAAMGGSPKYIFLTLSLPKDVTTAWFKQFLNGIHTACKFYGIDVLGGDTTGSVQSIFINICIVGEAQNARIKYRNTAQQGDMICVTGTLGDSAAGLKLLLGKKKPLQANTKLPSSEHTTVPMPM